MKKNRIILICLSLIAFSSILIGSLMQINDQVTSFKPVRRSYSQVFDPINTYNPDSTYIAYSIFRDTICTASSTVSEVESALVGKKLRIDTAEELYRFSMDVSYNVHQFYITPNPAENVKLSYDMITLLLSLDYVLGDDIDYSVVKSKQFVPIGYNFYSIDNSLNKNVFTGTFDGRGFEISNLYLAGYDYITTIEGENETTVDIALSPYYSMFTHNEGTIKNLGLINPTLELLEEHEDISRAANLVGLNSGIVQNVYVIDTRTDPYEAGIRFRVPTGTTSTRYYAAGIVFENQGTFISSYFASKIVVNASYINNFIVQPVLHNNSGTVDRLVYDSTVYLTSLTFGSVVYNITTPNEYAIGRTTSNLKSGNTVLNDGSWYFYAQDTYPILFGLDFSTNKYLINDSLDLIAFSKIVNFTTVKNGVAFRNANYVLTNNIDMSQVAITAYTTPTIEFNGTFNGEKIDGTNYYINNLYILNGNVYNGIYYSGLFSILNGTFRNVTFYNASIQLNNTNAYYSSIFKIGIVAGSLEGGRIEEVSANLNINLGTKSIGKTYVGGIVGTASGVVEDIYTTGVVDSSSHAFSVDHNITPEYSIGGIIGATGDAKLTLYNLKNECDVKGLGSSSSIFTTSPNVVVMLGGVIGNIQNTSTIKHDFGLLSNDGEVRVSNIISGVNSYQYVGGIFGLSSGNSYDLNSNFGRWENRGTIVSLGINASNTVRAAGIGVSNHNETVEFIHINNSGLFTTDNVTNFKYTSIIYDVGTTGVILSQATNYSSYTINVNGVTNFSPLFYSENNSPSLLRYCENNGDIIFSDITINAVTYISGITSSTNIDYLNVYYSGSIYVYNITATQPIWVSGITHTLTTNKYMKNSLNQGTITVANITNTANTYVGGLVNVNNAGDLHNQDASNQPKATSGIINSVNYANISSTYNSSVYGIKSTGNIYVGGIATLNIGSIQDTANLGNISIVNVSDLATSNVTYETATDRAGRITSFNGGVTVGGIVGAVTQGTSRIYDCANNGDIIGIAKNYVRAGGILAVCLYTEVSAGGVSAVNNIDDSILSNGLNYGKISAITATIASYGTSNTTQNFSFYGNDNSTLSPAYTLYTRTGTQERPPIYSCAGGVIGYGLSIMRRMLNHGEITATDVAGGIVGATYVLGTSSGSVTTIVNIDTAINYGTVRAINNGNYSSINKIDVNYSNISSYFYAVDSTFLYPVTRDEITRYPENKRGFGGIFGRLQRGTNGVMTSEGGNFNFIVNCDPNVDLIGRLDQVYNFTSSARYFRFNNCIYYSAKLNDTTQAVFTGFNYNVRNRTDTNYILNNVTSIVTTHTRSGTSPNYTWTTTTTYYFSTGTRYINIYEVGTQKIGMISTAYTTLTSTTTSNVTTSVQTVKTETGSSTMYPQGTTTDNTFRATYTTPVISSFSVNTIMGSNVVIPKISETPGVSGTEYMYDVNFTMRDPSTTLSNGEPITSYIYYAESGLLADRFQATRPNGMYVLSTSAGSSYGSVIPANMDITKVYRIDGEIPYDSDYENIGLSDKLILDTSVINKYKDLIQTKYNEKSALLETNQTIILEEIDGSNTVLITPSINFTNKTITYTISLEAFASAQASANYKIAAPNIPANALIAARIEDYQGGSYLGNVAGFISLLYQDRDKVVSDSITPNLQINLNSYRNITSPTSPILIGRFTSYSQASYNVTAFLNSNYTTQYAVYIILKPTASLSSGTIGLSNVVIDSTTYSVATYSSVPVNNTIRFNFSDTKGILNNGHDIKPFVSLYYGATQVDSNYYQLSSTAVSSGSFSVTFTMLAELRQGTYTFRYHYFEASPEYSHNFSNAYSSAKVISNLKHYSYSTFTPGGTTFTTYINFGYNIPVESITYQANIDPLIPAYLDNRTYSVSFLDEIELSPFASIQSITYIGLSYSSGYKIHHVRYIIADETGATLTYNHYIQERTINIVNVYKNNNKVNISNVFATREAELTLFSVDLGIDSNFADELYKLVDENPTSYFSVGVSSAVGEIRGISYSTDAILNINMTYETLPGVYTFQFTYHRDGQSITIATTLNITKRLGISAYLQDIKFSESATETSYAKIYEANSSGVINQYSTYDLRVYYAGIDYDGTDIIGMTNFRIDGQVANTPLNEYSPFFLDYLPYGATISRRAYNSQTGWYWTSEVDASSPDAVKRLLETDFTVFPDTGQEPGEEEDVIITYRVTSEDGTKQVFYHITVVDVVYNVTIVFNIYYLENEVATLAHQHVELQYKTILINIKNFNTDVALTSTPAPTVADFLNFTTITGYNNNTSQFFVPFADDYRYRFGRNISGFFSFNFDLPKDEYGNEKYDYYITFNSDPLNNLSNYVDGIDGKYYYINYGTKNRTRRFNVYISKLSEISENENWGLVDYSSTW